MKKIPSGRCPPTDRHRPLLLRVPVLCCHCCVSCSGLLRGIWPPVIRRRRTLRLSLIRYLVLPSFD